MTINSDYIWAVAIIAMAIGFFIAIGKSIKIDFR
jgi:hypothetical protein